MSRRSSAVFALAVALMTLLLITWHGNSAWADSSTDPAYPPKAASSTSTLQIEPSSEHQVPSASSSSNAGADSNGGSGLSSTGFQTLAATTIAVALLGSGAIFLGLGRRRRHG